MLQSKRLMEDKKNEGGMGPKFKYTCSTCQGVRKINYFLRHKKEFAY